MSDQHTTSQADTEDNGLGFVIWAAVIMMLLFASLVFFHVSHIRDLRENCTVIGEEEGRRGTVEVFDCGHDSFFGNTAPKREG